MTPDILIEAGDWPEATPRWAMEAVAALAAELGGLPELEISILLTDNAHIQSLNAEYRDQNKPTNVLSWPAIEFARESGETPEALSPFDESLGDLAFGYEICAGEAQEIGLENHFKHLTIHGVLHLLGYDHIDDKDAEKMEALEVNALSRLRISNPYEDVPIKVRQS